jgi:hypothetical protein
MAPFCTCAPINVSRQGAPFLIAACTIDTRARGLNRHEPRLRISACTFIFLAFVAPSWVVWPHSPAKRVTA